MAWDGLAWPGSLSFLTGGGARYQTFGRLRNPRRLGLEKDDLPCPSAQKACPARSRLRRHSPTTPEVVRDYCAEQTKGTRGTFHEFRRAWILVSHYLQVARSVPSESMMFTNGFTCRMLARLVRIGLATTQRENTDASSQLLGHVRITEAGRQALEGY
jgi:hypothetical protein